MFSKSDLKLGYVVECRDGKFRMVAIAADETIYLISSRDDGRLRLDDFRDDLTCKHSLKMDIIRVFGYAFDPTKLTSISADSRLILWVRTDEEKHKQRSRIYANAIGHWGYDKQIVVAMEELAELIQAISKHQRARDKNASYNEYTETKQHLAEEIADVLVMIEQVKLMYGIGDGYIEEWIDTKTERLRKVLEKIKDEKK